MIEVSVGEHFGNSDHNSVSFKVLVDKDKSGPWVKVLNWEKTNYNNVRQDLESVDWGRLFKSTSDIWESFKCQLIGIQDWHVPVRMKDKSGEYWKPWITRDIMSLVKKKKEAFI